jgi:hypothetical protein
MPPQSPTVRQILAAQYAEVRRAEARHMARRPSRRPRRRIRFPRFPRPLAALRSRRAAAAGC